MLDRNEKKNRTICQLSTFDNAFNRNVILLCYENKYSHSKISIFKNENNKLDNTKMVHLNKYARSK